MDEAKSNLDKAWIALRKTETQIFVLDNRSWSVASSAAHVHVSNRPG